MGLEAANHLKISELTVVGDSVLIIGQMNHYRPPKKDPLRSIYRKTGRLADQMNIQQSKHHYRQYNKMADSLPIKQSTLNPAHNQSFRPETHNFKQGSHTSPMITGRSSTYKLATPHKFRRALRATARQPTAVGDRPKGAIVIICY